ncbi:hypothetical protein ScPMuIL_003984 [Solemya velum]
MAAPISHGHVLVEGFTVVPVRYSAKSKAGHCLYLKSHNVQGQDGFKPRERTLFILNVPSYCTEACLKRVFSPCGKVLNVYIHDKPTSGPSPPKISKFFPLTTESLGFKVAYIVFKDVGSVQKACQLPYKTPLILSTPETPLLTGMRKWCADYAARQVDIGELQTEVSNYMEKFESRMEQEKEEAKEAEGVPDAEGWVTVTRHTKNKAAVKFAVGEHRHRGRKRKKEKDIASFYSFQLRESKREHIATLRKKFEEDKQRIALMKAARKFKPY